MRLLLALSLLVTGCGLFETTDHEYDFPPEQGRPAPTASTPAKRPPSSSSSGGYYDPTPPNITRTGGVRYEAIETGDDYTCGLLPGGEVDCWGAALADQPDALVEMSGSAKTACGVDPNGTLKCWGAAAGFEPPIGGRLTKIGVGDGFACALDDEGHPHCWGPQAIAAPADETFSALAVGTEHACGVRPKGSAVCWGTGLGSKAPEPFLTYRAIAAGEGTTCALTDGGLVDCWGELQGFQGSQRYTSVSVTRGKACALSQDGYAECFGLGINDPLTPPAFWFSSLSLGPTHACALRKDSGLAVCWGSSDAGESSPPR